MSDNLSSDHRAPNDRLQPVADPAARAREAAEACPRLSTMTLAEAHALGARARLWHEKAPPGSIQQARGTVSRVEFDAVLGLLVEEVEAQIANCTERGGEEAQEAVFDRMSAGWKTACSFVRGYRGDAL